MRYIVHKNILFQLVNLRLKMALNGSISDLSNAAIKMRKLVKVMSNVHDHYLSTMNEEVMIEL